MLLIDQKMVDYINLDQRSRLIVWQIGYLYLQVYKITFYFYFE
jgi:hypothetical protein